jgi:Eukaryotic aspartyl protease
MAIAIGSKNTLFTVMLDSTSDVLWIPSENCTTGGCANSARLGHADSTSLTTLEDIPFDSSYDTLSKGSVSGVTAYDNVSIAGLSDNAYFSLANYVDTNVTRNVQFHPPSWLTVRNSTVF